MVAQASPHEEGRTAEPRRRRLTQRMPVSTWTVTRVYRPGSTVFLVWQRQQRASTTLGDFDFGRDVDALWGIPAHNRLIVKVNYWLGL